MTANNPEVVAYHHINKENPEHRGVSLHHDASCTNTLINTEPLIRLSDYEALQTESEKLRKHLQNVIDQTTPLEPVPGNPMWSRRIQLDEVIAERDSLRAECDKLLRDAERGDPLGAAIQRAAAELPEGWEIHLCVVRDSDGVDLIGPVGTEDFYTDNERLDYTVIDALEFAISAAMQEEST